MVRVVDEPNANKFFQNYRKLILRDNLRMVKIAEGIF